MSERDELAEHRTALAEDRTLLANERTFAGWVRTGLSFVGIALGFHALFNRMQPAWSPRAISTGFLLAAVIVFIAAWRRAAAVNRRLGARQVRDVQAFQFKLLAGALVLGTVVLIAAIWLLMPMRS